MSDSHQGTATKSAQATIEDLEQTWSQALDLDGLCLRLAQVLHVRRNEVAILRLEKNCLRFVFPVELKAAGVLPLSGSAVATRTAGTRTPFLSNSFPRVKHVSLFESVKLAGGDSDEHGLPQMPIQKIMSVPVLGPTGNVLGVVQVSRKGLDAALAGADFTNDDLKQLEKAAAILAGLPFMQEGAVI